MTMRERLITLLKGDLMPELGNGPSEIVDGILAELRKPDDAMLMSGAVSMVADHTGDELPVRFMARNAFIAMIDAIGDTDE